MLPQIQCGDSLHFIRVNLPLDDGLDPVLMSECNGRPVQLKHRNDIHQHNFLQLPEAGDGLQVRRYFLQCLLKMIFPWKYDRFQLDQEIFKEI